jgi:hypothetical protein
VPDHDEDRPAAPGEECDECAALVVPGRMPKHMAWHDKISDELLSLLHQGDR